MERSPQSVLPAGDHPSPPHRGPRYSGKRPFFWAMTLTFPFALLTLVELILRIFGLYPLEPFIVPARQGGKDVYQFNQWVAKRYFDPVRVSVPAMSPETFVRIKAPNTFRIFCLGESTTAGFPFECQVPFPKQLQVILARSFPQYQFEVVNAGISAVNSFTVIDLLPDILDAQPDLILVYMGHNEFYGAYGSASTVSLGQDDGVIRFLLKIHRLHLVQMVRRLTSIFSTPGTAAGDRSTLMAGVVRDQEVTYKSEKYLRTLSAFRTNLQIICTLCQEKGVPLMVSTLFSNISDLAPFGSKVSDALSHDRKEFIREAMRSGDSLFAAQRYQESLVMYREAVAADSGIADAWYAAGRALALQGNDQEAYASLARAKDRDLVPFRASEDFNEIIREVARNRGVGIVDVLETFRQHSPQRLIGKDLMCDHLHPTPQGYYLMATTFYDAIRESGMLKGRDTTFVPQEHPYEVTDLDWDIGLLKIRELMNHWPFREGQGAVRNITLHGDSITAAIAFHYLHSENVWSKAHYAIAETYIKRKEFNSARNEYRAVTVFAPDLPYPYVHIARTYELEGDWGNRETALQQALLRSATKGMILYEIAMSQWKQGKMEDACTTMEKAASSPDLKFSEQQNARFYLAGFFMDAHRPEKAVQILHALLAEDPGFRPAQQFLSKIEHSTISSSQSRKESP
jgi:tetratricopeptide (TPR) repeat protein